MSNHSAESNVSRRLNFESLPTFDSAKRDNMENILEVQDIHTFIGQYHILQGVNVTVPKGSITALLGRNGAGKTTTLKSIIGLLTPRQGKVILDGREVQGM